jgi:hypothetical protein
MNKLNISLIALLSLFLITSCVKENFDEPPEESDFDPDIETNASISDITDKWVQGEFTTIEEDLTLDAVVVADDQSGNYYKTIIIQDETGGIELNINSIGVFNNYPIGRKIYLHCKDLIISDYNGLIQLGGTTFTDDGDLRLGGIEESLLDRYIVKGPRGQTIVPKVTTINDLGREDLSTLVQLNNVQFISDDTSSTYADAVQQFSFNLDIENCSGNTIVLRSSGFADFADENVPNGNGTIVAIYSTFRNTKQLFIRDTSDVMFTGSRCGTTGSSCDAIGGDKMTIEEVRNAFMGAEPTLPDNSYIEAVVISDVNNENTFGTNAVVQDESGYGIVIHFADFHDFKLNDRLKVDVSEQMLSEYNGLLQIQDVPLSNACKDGSGSVTPAVVDINTILSEFERYESTLVQVDNVLLSGGTEWSDGPTASDGSGEITVYTRNDAPFSNRDFPTDSLRLTAIVGEFNDPQLTIRNLNDVVVIGGGTNGSGLSEDFQTGSDATDIDLSGWTNEAVAGSRVWRFETYQSNVYAQATAFNSEDARNETWLITPEINTAEASTLSFETAKAFHDHDGLTVYVSDNYTGDISSATWSVLDEARIAEESDDDHEWIPSGDIDLSVYGGTVHVAFKYEGSSPDEDTSYRIDNVEVK